MDTGWRCTHPAQALGCPVEVIPDDRMDELLLWPHDQRPCRWWLEAEYMSGAKRTFRSRRQFRVGKDWRRTILQTRVVLPDHQGAAVWIRPCLARASLAKAMRVQGIRTVAELDDNYLSNPRLNLAMRTARYDQEMQLDHLKAQASMNAIVFSTVWLRDFYARKIRQAFGKVPGLELHVCGNHAPAAMWPGRDPYDGPPRVGWMGSPSHVWDVDLAWPALMHARNLGAVTHLIGYNPVDDPLGKGTSLIVDGEELEHRSERSLWKINQWRKVGFKHTPWVDPADYRRQGLPLDIGLCPLLTNDHTLGKSDVKAVEYTISGAAVVAQNNPVYNRTWVHGETALLVGGPQEMLEAVELLIRKPKLRERLVENARQYVREQRGDKQLKEEWSVAIAG